MYQRFRDWRTGGFFDRLHIRISEQHSIDLDGWLIDSTALRASRASSGTREKRRPKHRRTMRSPGAGVGMTNNIYMQCDADGLPLPFLFSVGQASDIAFVHPILGAAHRPSLRERPRTRCGCMLGRKGYEADVLRRYWDRY